MLKWWSVATVATWVVLSGCGSDGGSNSRITDMKGRQCEIREDELDCTGSHFTCQPPTTPIFMLEVVQTGPMRVCEGCQSEEGKYYEGSTCYPIRCTNKVECGYPAAECISGLCQCALGEC
jgi:hypothetical protein